MSTWSRERRRVARDSLGRARSGRHRNRVRRGDGAGRRRDDRGRGLPFGRQGGGLRRAVRHRGPLRRLRRARAPIRTWMSSTSPLPSRATSRTHWLARGRASTCCARSHSPSMRGKRPDGRGSPRRGLFLMEAIWSRYLPAYRSLVDVIGEGRIGDPLLVEADFGFRRPVEPDHRHFDWSSAAARCSTWGSIRSSCARWCWARSSTWWPTASSARPASTKSRRCVAPCRGGDWASSSQPCESACRARPASRVPRGGSSFRYSCIVRAL